MRYFAILLAFTILPVQAEDWTVNEKEYHNVKVVQVDDDLVSITYDGGMGRLAIADLSPDLKKRFNYDASKAKAADLKRQEDQAEATAESSDSLIPSVDPIKANSTIIQVMPTGFLGSFMTSSGQLSVCFIKCDTTGMIDGQPWTGEVIPYGTFAYTDTTGAACTVAQFTTDLNAKATAMPPLHGFPRPPVSSTTAVGGG